MKISHNWSEDNGGVGERFSAFFIIIVRNENANEEIFCTISRAGPDSRSTVFFLVTSVSVNCNTLKVE